VIPIIIVNWNGYTDTIECIESTLKTTDIEFHIHLIDNGSENSEGQRLLNLYQDESLITVHQYDLNYGFTGAHLKIWEEILNHQDHTHIALLNNDTIIDPQWLTMLYQMTTVKGCGIVSTKMIQYYDRTLMDNAGHKMLNTGEILPIGYGKPIQEYTDSFKNMGGCGGGVLYETDMIRDIGFFDDYFNTGYEDAEYGLRAVVSGYECWYCPDAIVYHKGGQSIKKVFNEEYSTMIFTAILYSYLKNLPFFDLVINLPFVIFKYVCMIIIDLIFLRWRYLRIMTKSVVTANLQWPIITQLRKSVKRSSYSITPKFTFFFWFDVKRFIALFISNDRQSSIDNYR